MSSFLAVVGFRLPNLAVAKFISSTSCDPTSAGGINPRVHQAGPWLSATCAMEIGRETSTRLSWRNSPELLLNDEPLAEILAKLRSQVQTLEKHELLSGTALPPWLVKALSEVANSADAVVECQTLRDQVASLQKEVLDLRHEMLLQQSSSTGGGSSSQGYNPTPYHRQSTGRMRVNQTGPSIRPSLSSMPSQRDMSAEFAAEATATATATATSTPTRGSETTPAQAINVDGMLKPLWDAIHKQTNDFSALRQSFHDAKDTVARLQAEIKRRDAVVQARNNKHEGFVQAQMDKLNESLRACVTQNDLIGAEQRIAQQMKIDRQRMLDEVEDRSNKIVEDLLTSRSEQEDINSTYAEMLENITRKQTRSEEVIAELRRKQQEADVQAEAMQGMLVETVTKLVANTTAVTEMGEKVKSFEETQSVVVQHSSRLDGMQRAHEELKMQLEHRIGEKIADSVVMLRGEIATVNGALQDLISLNLDSEIKSVAGKLDMTALTVADCVRKIATIQKQATATDDHNRSQFIQAFDSIDRIQHSMSTLSEESIRISYSLQKAMENADTFSREMNEYRSSNDRSVENLQKDTRGLQDELERTTKSVDNELGMIKNQLFHIEEVTSAHKREIEDTQREVERNFRSQYQENKLMQGSLESLHAAKEELGARQDRAESQMMALQAENRAEIQAATNRLVAIVDKESDRVEALYASFQKKQDDFAEVVARSSIRNMDLVDLNREIDRVCESFVSECWKFETSARSSNKTSARASDNNNSNNMNTSGRKLFNERQQQLLSKNCQFIADLVVARAEYEVLHTGCNKDIKNQNNMEELMIDQQGSVLEKVRLKIFTKIMNNKNIGEQFDKTALDRRELYIDTVNNMLAASLKRRTMVGASRQESKNNLPDGSFGGVMGGDFLETQRLVGVASAGGGTSRMKSARDSRQSLSFTPSGLSGDPASSRMSTFSPSTSSVLRAGFRLPKASTPASMRKSLVSPLVTPSATVSEMEDEHGDVFVPAASDPNAGQSVSDHTMGWGSEEQEADASGLSKSYSLPALKQQ